MTVQTLNYSDFLAYLNQGFQVQTGGHDLIIELVEAKLLNLASSNANKIIRRSPFSLVFKGPPHLRLSQKIYHLQHDVLGAMDIFLVPVARRDDGMCYEAIFS